MAKNVVRSPAWNRSWSSGAPRIGRVSGERYARRWTRTAAIASSNGARAASARTARRRNVQAIDLPSIARRRRLRPVLSGRQASGDSEWTPSGGGAARKGTHRQATAQAGTDRGEQPREGAGAGDQ